MRELGRRRDRVQSLDEVAAGDPVSPSVGRSGSSVDKRLRHSPESLPSSGLVMGWQPKADGVSHDPRVERYRMGLRSPYGGHEVAEGARPLRGRVQS